MRNLAIINTHSNVASVSRENGILQGFDKDYNIVTLDENKVSIEESRLQAEYDAQEYARNRATGYPSIPDQLDEIFHNGIDSWKALIKVTKDKYPKG